jgi:hypothetical protein
MPDNYHRIGAGIDAHGIPWAVGVHGTDVLVAIPHGGITLDPATRQVFTAAYLTAVHEAETTGSPVITSAPSLDEADAMRLENRLLAAVIARDWQGGAA